MVARRVIATLLTIPSLLASPCSAQDDAETEAKIQSIQWIDGPTTASISTEASIQVPIDCRFTAADGARTFMELTQNPTSGNERGILICPDNDEAEMWFAVFSFNDTGYVRDDEGKSLDADAILQSIRRGTEAANEERRRRGWEPVEIGGWSHRPYYDPATNNLTWAIRTTRGTINHSVRLLGRNGVMNVDLVINENHLGHSLPEFDRAIANFTFLPGERYAEWREGDKVAEYGLTALVAGGAGVVAAKTGLLSKVGKLAAALLAAMGKFVFVLVIGALAGLKSLFFSKKKSGNEPGG